MPTQKLMILNSPIKMILTYLYLVLLQEELQKLRPQTIEDTSLSQKIPIEDLISRIKAVDWNGHSCANGGVYWLTKFEFLEQYIKSHEPNRTKESHGNLFDLL